MVYSASSEKWGKYCKQIPTNHLIVLCEIEEDFKSFYSDLEKLIKSKWNKDPLTKLYHAMQGKTSMGSHKYNSFIEKHKRTIEIMRRYSCLSNLTILSYDANGIRVDNLVEDYFYQYIQKHKEDIDKIKDVALKIKELGISKINYYEHLDFSQFEYTLDTSYKCEFSFLENMEIIPTYSSNQIKYKTKNSCYCLTLEFSGYGNNKKLSNYGKSIVVNNLVFNPNRLPDKLTSESTIGLIYELAEKEKKAKMILEIQ